ncbi:MAG: amino acid racemase [Halieaceae bacterium]|jgi:aspartate racemase|nr:amino acid racemase [Halieaceae bacterium]
MATSGDSAGSSAAEGVVGVLGGMGPAATIDLLQRLVDLRPAKDDADHLRVLVDNNPKVPSRIAALIDNTGPSPAPVLIAMARGLQAQGADFLVMPCNTAHHYHAEIAATVDIPFLNLMELVRRTLKETQPRPRRVGLLASSALRMIRLYEPYLAEAAIEVVYPAEGEQAQLMALIRAVKAGRVRETGTDALTAAAASLESQGVDQLLIACTELSALAGSLRSALPALDAADVLARAVIERAEAGAR